MKDTAEMLLEKLWRKEAIHDCRAPTPKTDQRQPAVLWCYARQHPKPNGQRWNGMSLTDTLNGWFKPKLITQVGRKNRGCFLCQRAAMPFIHTILNRF